MSDKPIIQMKEILPVSGLWNLESLASYLKMRPAAVQQSLSDKGIKVMQLGIHYENRLVSMAEIAKYFEAIER